MCDLGLFIQPSVINISGIDFVYWQIVTIYSKLYRYYKIIIDFTGFVWGMVSKVLFVVFHIHHDSHV
jgi:hypothetical protein